jgi:hypothetical protein
VRNAKIIIVDGIRFRSRLEVYCYEQLKKYNIPFEYEQHTYVLVEPFEYVGTIYELHKKVYKEAGKKVRAMTYTPDFVGDHWIIETKGQVTDTFPLRWKLFKRYLVNNSLIYDLYVPHNHKQIDETIKKIEEKNEYNRT